MQNEFNEALDKNLVNYTNSVESSPKMDIINDEENTRDMDLKILIQINESISELFARNIPKENSINDYHIYNNNIDIGKSINSIPYLETNQIYQNHINDKHILKTDILSDCTGPELLTNSVSLMNKITFRLK